MRQRLTSLGLLFLMVLVLALGGLLLAQRTEAASDLAPSFSITSVDGEEYSLAGLRGRPVVINFWASWCPPCMHEIPAFSAYAKAHPDVAVLGVAVESGPARELPRVKADLGISYPVFAADPKMVSAYRVRALPTTVVVSADGRIASHHTGALSGAELARAVDAAR